MRKREWCNAFLRNRQSTSRLNVAMYPKVCEGYMDEISRDLERDRTRFIAYLPGSYTILGIPGEERLKPVWQHILPNHEPLTDRESMDALLSKFAAKNNRFWSV